VLVSIKTVQPFELTSDRTWVSKNGQLETEELTLEER
jgi:hypothetical protein